MGGNNHHPPGLGLLARRLASTGLGLLRNRAELLSLEWQQEKAREVRLALGAMSAVFLSVMGVLLLTATIIFLFPVEFRIYAAMGFALLYLIGAGAAILWLKSVLNEPSFPETINQVKKDSEWLQNLR